MKKQDFEEKVLENAMKMYAIIHRAVWFIPKLINKIKGPKFKVGFSFKDSKGKVRTVAHCKYHKALGEYVYRLNSDSIPIWRQEDIIKEYLNEAASDEDSKNK